MIDLQLIAAVVIGIGLLLTLILALRIQAFISLLIASITVGLIAGLSPDDIIATIQQGMGSTLGYVATVVGLGAMFGAILEYSGGAQSIAKMMVGRLGEKQAPSAMMLTGFLVAIPVFFDVAFIILIPVIYALQRKTKKSLLLYAIPLLAGLAITHAFIPPTPGPIAVAETLGADLGWVILAGAIVGFPTAIVSGLLFGKYIAKRIHVEAPEIEEQSEEQTNLPGPLMILAIIGIPILLILVNTVLSSIAKMSEAAENGIEIGPKLLAVANMLNNELSGLMNAVTLIGHPFVALIIANLIAWITLGILRGTSRETLFTITTKSMAPAGVIILLTGAGGVFKQVLINTGAGEMLAQSMTNMGFPFILFGFLAAVLIRVIQGSATVAMITAAGMTAPLLENSGIEGFSLALIVIAIAAGSSIFSHVNDSGFWLVSQYLGISEKDTFRSWTMMTTLLALSGFLAAALLFFVI